MPRRRLLPPTGWGDVATRRDLELLEARLDAKLGQLMRTWATWLFASQAAMIAAVSMLVALD